MRVGALLAVGALSLTLFVSCGPQIVNRTPHPVKLDPDRPFPNVTSIVYAHRYAITVRPLLHHAKLRTVTVRYDVGWPWSVDLNDWAVIDSFIQPASDVSLRSYLQKGDAAIIRIAYPSLQVRFALWRGGDRRRDLFTFTFQQEHPVATGNRHAVQVCYFRELNDLPLPPTTRTHEPIKYDGLRLYQPGADAQMRDRVRAIIEQRAFMGTIISIAPLFVLPEAEVSEMAAEEGTSLGQAMAGRVAVGASAEDVVGATQAMSGFRLTGRSFLGIAEEAYTVDEAGIIRATEFNGNRMVGKVGPGGDVVSSGEFRINGQQVKYIMGDGSLFSERTVEGFIGRMKPDGNIVSFLGDKIGTAARE